MQLKEVTSESQKETMQLGARLAKLLKPGDIVCLYGDLGTGKTTFVKGMAKGLKISETEVHSPTFVLMNLYEGRVPLFHFDFYRLDDIQQIGMIGYDEFLYDDGIAVVEWAEKLRFSLVPVIAIETYAEEWQLIQGIIQHGEEVIKKGGEGIVAQSVYSHYYGEDNFKMNVGKYVREDHVETDSHWMKKPVEKNILREK